MTVYEQLAEQAGRTKAVAWRTDDVVDLVIEWSRIMGSAEQERDDLQRISRSEWIFEDFHDSGWHQSMG
jgi:hypothetical protein